MTRSTRYPITPEISRQADSYGSSPRIGERYEALDLLRGLVIILMAVDHAGYFVARVHPGEFWGIPLPQYENAAAFLTRFITHLAAPGFFFLMGASIVFLSVSRRRAGWSDGRIARHLITRGLLLFVLQLFVENPAWLLATGGGAGVVAAVQGGGSQVLLHFGVLYGLGAAMIVCATLLRAPTMGLLALGAVAVALTQWLTPGPDQAATLFSPVARLLLVPGHTNLWQVFYPLIPWFAVAVLGMTFARAMQHHPEKALRHVWIAGLVCLLAFVVLRALGGFGNIHPADGSGWIAFLNVTKYPPSLVFLLLTLGANLVLLSVLNAAVPWLSSRHSPLMVFGQSALAFYLLHLYVYGLAGLQFPRGTTLMVMYAVWLAGLLALYPVCRRYRAFKQSTKPDSLWRLF